MMIIIFRRYLLAEILVPVPTFSVRDGQSPASGDRQNKTGISLTQVQNIEDTAQSTISGVVYDWHGQDFSLSSPQHLSE